jgi:hypothetical protein
MPILAMLKHSAHFQVGPAQMFTSPAVKVPSKLPLETYPQHDCCALLWDAQVNVPPGPAVLVNGRRLQLVQFHWHRSSEHTLDGRHYAMELHLVHREPASGATVARL